MPRLHIRSAALPALQAVLTAVSTAAGVLLVLAWRPDRPRRLPFYSDASHHDPERIVLAAGENLACALGAPVAVAEYLHLARRLVAAAPAATAPAAARAVRANFAVSLLTIPFFFAVANVPSRYPATRIHQFAASALILCYAVQATLKLWIHRALPPAPPHAAGKDAQHVPAPLPLHHHHHHHHLSAGAGGGDEDDAKKPAARACPPRDPVPRALRALPVIALWTALVGTFACFVGRVATKPAAAEWRALRDALAVAMAVLAHSATVSCVLIMAILAVDLRGEVVVLSALQ